MAHPDGRRLFLGLQRGGSSKGRHLRGGNTHLAVFSLIDERYIAQTYLAEVIGPEQSEDSTPHSLVVSPDGRFLYVGMFQSRQGILVIDLDSYEVLRGIRVPRAVAHQHIFDWADPLALAIYGDLLFSLNRRNYEFAVFRRLDDDFVGAVPLGGSANGPSVLTVLGDRALIGHDEYPGLLSIDLLGLSTQLRSSPMNDRIGGDSQEIVPEEIEEFRLLTTVPRPATDEWTTVMRAVSERQVKEAIASLLGDVQRSDWGGESADHYTGELHVHGKRLTAAFLLKGPAQFRPMTNDMLGKRADQIQRLACTEAGVLVLQYVHEIGPEVRKELRVWAREGPYPRYYCLMDGKDTSRLLKAMQRL